MTPRRVAIVGAGLAGLTAAKTAALEGAEVTVFERDAQPGGATADSAGWIWRYRDLATFREYAPLGDAAVQATIVARFDDDLAWLTRRGVHVRTTDTDRAFTHGLQIDPVQALDALSRQLEEPQLRVRTSVVGARRSSDARGVELDVHAAEGATAWERFDAVVFAGGGYAADTVRIADQAGVSGDVRERWVVRARHPGDGSSQHAARGLGAAFQPDSGESFARVYAVGAPITPTMLHALGELHVVDSELLDADGRRIDAGPHDWSGAQAVWQLARTTGAGTLRLPAHALRGRVHSGSVRGIVDEARAGGVDIVDRPDGGVDVPVCAGITHTMCGLQVDGAARVVAAGPDRQPIPGLYAAGCDAAGAGLGGTASGLAQALVLGRVAGAAAAQEAV